MTFDIGRFKPIYEEHVSSVLHPIEQAVRKIFRTWRQPVYWEDYKEYPENAVPSPTQRTKTRIKRIEAVLDKFRRMQDEFPGGGTAENLLRMRDAFGARVIVYFPHHLSMVDQEIREGPHFEVSPDLAPKSYLPRHMMEIAGLDPGRFRGASKKPSGYASLHYTVRLAHPVEPANPWFELQTRTMLEEVWGEVEHQIGYKPEQHTDFSVRRQFRVISDHLSALDSHFDFISRELAFQQAQVSASNVDENALLNAENMPHVLRRMDCVVHQKEIAGLLRILEDYGITTVRGLLRLGRLEMVEAITNEYRLVRSDRTPTAFDVVPVLLQLKEDSTPDEARRLLRLHLEIADQQRRR